MEKNRRINISRHPHRTRWVLNDLVVAETTKALVLNEESLPPKLYVPMEDVNMDVMITNDHSSHCPFKGDASYWDFQHQGTRIPNIAWAYKDPIDSAKPIKSYIAFYDHLFDWVCTKYTQP